MVKTKQSNKDKERVSLYLDSVKVAKAKKAAMEMDVPLSFIIEDILGSFLDSFQDDFEDDDDRDELNLADYYRWKFKSEEESKTKKREAP